MLKVLYGERYRVKRGDSLQSICEEFTLPPYAVARENCLEEEVEEGQLLRLPKRDYNVYTVKAEDSKTKLCGSVKKYGEINGTDIFYIGLKVFIL